MPNRKTFDEREKYDHSQHSTRQAEQGDLAATPTEQKLSSPKQNGGNEGASSPAPSQGPKPR
jgi:hypothetical protein